MVEVRLAGVCDTDLQLARGYMGFRGVPGHELVGRVLAADDAQWIDKRVVADINAGCGVCADCIERDGHHCATRTVLGIVGRSGAFAERVVVPERCLVEVPDLVTDERAVFAEPVAAALHVLDDVDPRGHIAVLGDGKLGLLIALSLASAGARVSLVGRHAHKLALAAPAGVTTYLEADAKEALSGVDAVVEATGNPGGLALALALVRPRGTVVLKTTVAEPLSIDLAPAVVNELRLVGSRCGDMRRAVNALAAGTLDPSKLVEARYPLAEADQAFSHAARKGALKILIDIAGR